MLNWLIARLSERTSQAALAVLLTQAGTLVQASTDWRTLVPLALACVVTVFLPEAGLPGAASEPKKEEPIS